MGETSADAGAPVANAASDIVQIERRGRVAIVFLNRPEAGNAMSAELMSALSEALADIETDAGVGALVITGRGKTFSAGAALGSLQTCTAAQMAERIRKAHGWVHRLANYRKPVIAAVNGPAVGAGFGLALLTDFVLMSSDAFVAAGFLAIGVVPDVGTAYMLPRYVGIQRAKEMIATNRRVAADEAVSIGLALQAFPHDQLITEAVAFAERVSTVAPSAFTHTKTLLNQSFDTSLSAFLEKEALLQTIVFGGEEVREGIAAFLEKRRPEFTPSPDGVDSSST